ncbi:MAG: hypothetical protein WC554_19765 [Clostridia bacterium]
MENFILVVILIYYNIGGFLWSIYAMLWQKKLYPDSTVGKYFLVGTLNNIFFPICIFLALKNFNTIINKSNENNI